MASTALYTFGYEGLTIEAFIERLQQARVQLIVDVRELPLSRKKGYSKTAFRAALAAAGIDYQHRPALGCPKPVRDRYKADGDWQAYTHSFLAYLSTQAPEIDALSRTALARQACLVCFEADFGFCHRTYVARAAHASGAPVVRHLTARTVLADEPERLAA
ncbi:DUF488 domain-containing protein [Leptothrix discophora]|uniref:DUF488 domain-containing protein n=1 Tax=Leptothrix discophora TaxID=89 RepID=A0ABT9G6N8_LEPDI|nr:DUF488 domain-containing protein [Leptothrix discophora]MDP4301848.1 DUF488 domain-containing protein [Leptothrix discophora]